MKGLRLLLAVLVLAIFVMPHDVNAQNSSAENSGVILFNGWYDFGGYVNCPETGEIVFNGVVHQINKLTSSGKYATHYNAHGEGIDEFGGKWTWIDAWNTSYTDGDMHETRVWTLQGPKGAKLQMKVVFIVKDGEIIIDKMDPLCEE